MSTESTHAATEVDLMNQQLTDLSDEIINLYGATCTTLNLTGNQLAKFDWIARFPHLKELILDKNSIAHLKSWPKSNSITTLYLNNNKIDDVRELMDCIVKSFPNLIYLSLHRNPCTPDMYSCEFEAEAYQRFRYYVLYRLPKLQLLDATSVDEAELREAKRIGHLMAPAKPIPGAVSPDASDYKSDAAGSSTSSILGGSSSASSGSNGGYDLKKVIESKNTRVATFLVKSKPRYDGYNSEGNRFITNEDL